LQGRKVGRSINGLFYQAIAKYELKKWDEAIVIFDKALKIYPEF